MRILQPVMVAFLVLVHVCMDLVKVGVGAVDAEIYSDSESVVDIFPQDLKCPSCRAVTYMTLSQLSQREKARVTKLASLGKIQPDQELPELEYLKLFEDICGMELYNKSYYATKVDGRIEMYGPGLPANPNKGAKEYNIVNDVDSYPITLCGEVVGQFGETELYNMYREYGFPKGFIRFYNQICFHEEIDACVPTKNRKRRRKKRRGKRKREKKEEEGGFDPKDEL